MTPSQRIAAALLTFSGAGLALIALDATAGKARTVEPPATFLAISSGPGLQLASEVAGEQGAAREGPILSCETVFSLGTLAFGTDCSSNGWQVSVTR